MTNKSLDQEQEKQLQANFDCAEWSLKMLNAGKHKHLERLLSHITSNFRVVEDLSVLERAQSSTCTDDDLHKNSTPNGTIRSSFKDGQISFAVYSMKDNTDPQQIKLLSLSQRELLNAVFDAIGLHKKTASTTNPADVFK